MAVATDWLLSKDAFIADCGTHAVILDVKSDEYLSIPIEESYLLRELVRGWPGSSNTDSGRHDLRSNEVVVEQLMERGLLTDNPAIGKLATPMDGSTAVESALSDSLRHPIRMRLRDVLLLMRLIRRTRKILINAGFRVLLQQIGAEKRSIGAHTRARQTNIESLLPRYLQARAFVFTSHNQCLLDSAVLMRYMTLQGLAADWVFGVRVNPFAAHCWVQRNGVVLNDSAERIATYTPIMRV